MLKVKIALSIPGIDEEGRYFALPLNQYVLDDRSEYRKANNILLISGTRGDFASLYRILLKRNIVNKYLEWTFEGNHLIIISDGMACDTLVSGYLWFIYSLQQKAEREGGNVHFILGRQEVLNLRGTWRYEHPKYAVVKPGSKDSATALFYGNNELWHWLSKRNIIEKIGPLLIVPGGISPAVNQLQTSIPKINRFVRKHYMDAAEPNFNGTNVELLLNSGLSPLHYTGYFDGAATIEQVNDTLEIFGVKWILTAYEGAAPGIYCNGKVINITAAPEKEGPAGLLIKGNNFYRLDHRGHRERIEL